MQEPLAGREAEQRALVELLAAARLRRSGVLVLTGEAGIGKTSLLDFAAAEAGTMAVVRLGGTQAESQTPYAALQLVLAAMGTTTELLPAAQTQALEVAFATRTGPLPNPFAVGAATLATLSQRADRGPVLLIVDDGHLVDHASATALAFATRRLVADSIAVVVAVRTGMPSPFASAGLPTLPVSGLDEPAVAELLRRLTGAGAHDLAPRALALTGGNPLALTELCRHPDLRARLALGEPLLLREELGEELARRVREAGPDAVRYVAIVAVCDGDPRLTAAAAAMLGLDSAVPTVLEARRLLTLGGQRHRLGHPLIGSASYSVLPPADRRAVHVAVAEALAPHSDARLRHLAAATLPPDGPLAAALDALAEQTAGRGAYAAAAALWEKAAGFCPGVAQRCDLLLAAARAAADAGEDGWAVRLSDRARAECADTRVASLAAATQGLVAMRGGSLASARSLLEEAVDGATGDDPDRAAYLLAELVTTSFYLADRHAAARAAQAATRVLTRGPGPMPAALCHMTIGMAEVLAGRSGEAELRAALTGFGQAAGARAAADATWSLLTRLWLRDADQGEAFALVDKQRAAVTLGTLPRVLMHLGRDRATRDAWSAAEAHYTEAVALALELGQHTEHAASLAALAWLEARRGEMAASRAHAADASRLALAHDNTLAVIWSGLARGECALGSGDADGAITHYREVRAGLVAADVLDVDLDPSPELVEALALAGRLDEASKEVERFAGVAQGKGRPWALARAGRARGTICPPDQLDEVFGAALDQHDATVDEFERARTLLRYGQRLRRERRRVEARARLGTALRVFETLGARAWADQAALELESSGQALTRRDASTRLAMTPRESQVVELLLAGHTTRETAARLFLSPKTVEYHLRAVYSRVGVSSRDQLRAALEPRGSRRVPSEPGPP